MRCCSSHGREVCSRVFFFFQAEDGIRDWSVTGVQTCALPILNRDSDPDLSLHGVLASSVEHFDAKVLFDPFEKQFYLPTALIDLGDGQCWKQKVVGQELESLLCFDIEITDSAQGIGIGFRGIDGGQNDGVIGSHTCGLVYRM